MDTSILQLFTTEEVLKRLAKHAATGCLHIFTPKEAANLFFQEGTIIGAIRGLTEGEDVIKKVLEWKDRSLLWHDGRARPEGLKPLDIQFPAFLASLQMEIGGKKPGGTSSSPDAEPITISTPSWAASTGPITKSKSKTGTTSLTRVKEINQSFEDAPPLPPAQVSKQAAAAGPPLSATTSLHSSSRDDDSFEEALMRKHQLALVSVGETPPQRLRIIRSSNLVGRNPACDFTMGHSSISRQHCLLQITERGLHVKDLSTTNGTKVNGIKLTEGYINIGDKLTMGNLDFLLEKDEPPVV